MDEEWKRKDKVKQEIDMSKKQVEREWDNLKKELLELSNILIHISFLN